MPTGMDRDIFSGGAFGRTSQSSHESSIDIAYYPVQEKRTKHTSSPEELPKQNSSIYLYLTPPMPISYSVAQNALSQIAVRFTSSCQHPRRPSSLPLNLHIHVSAFVCVQRPSCVKHPHHFPESQDSKIFREKGKSGVAYRQPVSHA